MKNVTLILASLMIISSATAFAAKPAKQERVAKVNPIQEQCIKPFKEEHSLLRQQKKDKFSEIKASFRSGEISEADLGAQLEKIAVEIETQLAALETKKEACSAQLEKVE